METFDVAVVGSGPGGYAAAIRCAQLGMKTALAERYPVLGGTCTNVGCIPSKALLDSSEHFYNAKNKMKQHGIDAAGLKLNFKQMMQRKNEVVKQNNDGLFFLMKKNKITVFSGTASFADASTLNINSENKETIRIKAAHFIIATGSKPAGLPGITMDKERIITSTEALSMDEVPGSMVIIGGGVIGLELGSVYARLGTQVSVIEYMDSILPTMDRSLGRELQKILTAEGINFYLSHKVESAVVKNKTVHIELTGSGKEKKSLVADYCLVAVGRKPYTQGLNIEKAGIVVDKAGRISVNEQLQTSVKNIYAIGDVVRGAMLAHKAEEEGVYVAEIIAGQKPHLNYKLIPGVVYTWPEAASVGYSEEELKQEKINYKTGSFPFRASGRARASADTYGFVKVLAHADTDEILGVHIIGARAADLIAQAVTAMEFRASAEDVARMCHAHPTYSEAIKEACLAATANRAIHL